MKDDRPNLFINSAKYYDYDNRDNLTADIPFYIDYARRAGGEVLELGCGTGRVSLALAEAGFRITGVDLSDSMLYIMKEKLKCISPEAMNRVTVYKGDMSRYSLDKKFGLIIIPFRAFQLLTEDKDIAGCLKRSAGHLEEGGLFIVNVFRPYKTLDESWCYPDKVQWTAIDDEVGLEIIRKHSGTKIDPENQVIYVDITYEVVGKNGTSEKIKDKLCLKYYYYSQLKELLEAYGFVIAEEYGWYDKSGIAGGRELIFVCRKR